jgi:two-component sensor histidine kinase
MGAHGSELLLPAEASSVRVARRVARDQGRGAGLDPETIEDLGLVVSELVTNAVAVTQHTVGFRLDIDGEWLRVEVDDEGGGRPHEIEGSERGGFGLRIVGVLATRWGCTERGTGKTVWAELSLSR